MTSVTDSNREVIQRMYALGAAGDLEGVSKLCSPSYRLTQSPAHAVPGSWTGSDADAAAGRVFGAMGVSGIDVNEVIADGEHRVIGLVEAHGTDGDGNPWSMPVAECFWVEDGQVTDIRPFYWDFIELRRIAATRGVSAEDGR